MKFEVTILGSSSATPIFHRNPTSQILNINDKLLMIDCGEGTQQQMLRYGIKYHKIDHIFISHLHGDHFFGLVGLISSMHLNGRTKPLYLYAPAEIKEILEIQFKHSGTQLKFPIEYHFTQTNEAEIILDNNGFTVQTFVLNHRIPCTGFIFREKERLRKINKALTEELNVPQQYFQLLKKGIDFIDEAGVRHKAKDLTFEPDVPRAYAYCSDTLADGSYNVHLENVDTLYHESTFMHDMADRAKETFHSTAREAAELAKSQHVKKLLIGHFSARYRDLSPLLLEAREIFPNTFLAQEGETFLI
ncbi:ribonuclease Z [Pelobium manganitolerans]|uniref:Ribonuclease Z n=1 Tax=Pelobium manganitolerans TaxID=1842495 RepID=A0A419S3J0_9SPHI|nr:ribonuclease Z [Pelobium manganitolerans]RKD13862.1 ribonuclease Z [Pelobium manganitolerans]